MRKRWKLRVRALRRCWRRSAFEVRFAFYLTLLWAFVLIGLLFASEPCEPAVQPTLYFPWISCLEPNEIGDFLAGAFAPLAFLWLVTAVLVQGQELRAQREELRLTRREFSQTREVLDEQAAAARDTAGYMKAQTDVLTRQFEAEIVAARDASVSKLLDDLSEVMRARLPLARMRSMEAGDGSHAFLSNSVFPSDRTGTLQHVNQAARKETSRGAKVADGNTRSLFLTILHILTRIRALEKEGVSAATRATLITAETDVLHFQVARFLDLQSETDSPK